MLKFSIKNILFLILFAFPNTVLSFGILFIINNVISGNKNYEEPYLSYSFLMIIIFTYLRISFFKKGLINTLSMFCIRNSGKAIKETETLTAQEEQLKNSVNIDFDF